MLGEMDRGEDVDGEKRVERRPVEIGNGRKWDLAERRRIIY
jgi:hypothetical protein